MCNIFREYLFNIFAIGGICRDITDLKFLELQLRQASKMESLGTLAGGIAHDFNNIIFMITGNAELILDDLPDWDPKYDYIKEIKNAGLRAASIVKQLLHFTRKSDQHFKPIGAISVIHDALKFLRATIPTTVGIKTELPDDECMILGDPVQLHQVLMNICTNAFQVLEESGGIIEIKASKFLLSENEAEKQQDLPPGDYLLITIADDGPGIAHDTAERIFDPYFTTKVIGEGSGMGLTIALGIIKNHHGIIKVDSSPNEGTTFSIYLPLREALTQAEVKTSESMPMGTESILFIDDEIQLCLMMQRMLSQLGYKVDTETNPLEALKQFEGQPELYNLVITDMTMPQMTGVLLAEKIKSINKSIPVIICTGYSSLINEEKAKALGIQGYVMKPIVKKELAQVVRAVLDANKEEGTHKSSP